MLQKCQEQDIPQVRRCLDFLFESLQFRHQQAVVYIDTEYLSLTVDRSDSVCKVTTREAKGQSTFKVFLEMLLVMDTILLKVT